MFCRKPSRRIAGWPLLLIALSSLTASDLRAQQQQLPAPFLQCPAPSDLATSRRLRDAIARLASADPLERESADVFLRNLPAGAAPAVRTLYDEFRSTPHSELSTRLRQCTDRLRTLEANHDRQRELADWLRRHALHAYDAHGARNPTWDDDARELIGLATDPGEPYPARVRELQQKLTAAGCTDPLVRYCLARFQCNRSSPSPSAQGDGRGEGRVREPDDRSARSTRPLRDAWQAMQHSNYPASLKCLVAGRCADGLDPLSPPGARRQLTSPMRADAQRLFGQLERDGERLPDAFLFELAVGAQAPEAAGWDWEMHAFRQVYSVFERLAPDSPYLPLFKGIAYRERIYDRPPPAHASHPRFAEADLRVEAFIRIAEEAMTLACERLPDDPRVPLEMLRLKSRIWADPDEIGEWFDKALRANPDSLEACRLRWRTLPPEQWLDFGRALAHTKSYRARLPFLLVEMHEELARQSGNEPDYFSRDLPWTDVSAVFRGYLEWNPQDQSARARFARLSALRQSSAK